MYLRIGRKKRKTNVKKSSSNAEETAGDPSLSSGAAVLTAFQPPSSVRTSSGDAEETAGDPSPDDAKETVVTLVCHLVLL